MISFVEGKIEFKGEKYVIINVGGVGYKIFAGIETLRKIPEKNADVKLWTHMHVREDAMDLYGFLYPAELELFETLIGISGIGPRTALAILAMGSVDNLRRAIASGDSSYLTRVSGIGKKTAERVVMELKDKMAGRGVTVEAPELREEVDALDALIALGYSQREARDALAHIPAGDTMNAEKRIKEALKKIGKNK